MKSQFFQRMRLVLFLLPLVPVSLGGGSLSVAASGEDWRPIEVADLALKEAVVEPHADAEAIFWDIRIDDGGDNSLVLNHYVRIKIFTERGRDQHSKVDIPYFSGTKVQDIAARTIKPDGTIVELAKNDIVEKMVVKISGFKLKTKTFAFPGIEPGAIIEYKWKEIIFGASAQDMRLQFQLDIPVQSITYRIKPLRQKFFDVKAFNMPKFQFHSEKNGFQATTVTRMPAFHEEPLMPPEDSVRAWAMVRYQGLFSVLSTYYLVANSVYSSFQPYMKVDQQIQEKSDEITAGAKTPEEKLKRIFEFCRRNIKNTSDANSGYTAEEIDKLKENEKASHTLKRGVGSSMDINLLFASLANAAGFKTRIALLPDRGQRLFDRNELVPGAIQPSNIAVRVGEQWQFFDPGLPYIERGMLRWQEEGVEALLADPDPIWLRTPLSPPEKSKEILVAKLNLDENGTLEGDIEATYTGHLAAERMQDNAADSPVQREENLKEGIKSRLGSAELSNVVIENATDPEKPFSYRYHVRVPEYAQRTGKRLFFQPGYFQKGVSSLFSTATRRYPIYFHFPWSEEHKITITLPKGYALENAERPAPIAAGGICKHEINMGVNNDQTKLMVTRTFSFGGTDVLLFPVDNYADLKRLFDEIHKADNHMLTLRQATASN